jgi:ribonuclease HIII
MSGGIGLSSDKYERYEELKKALEEGGCNVLPYRDINCGIQFNVTNEGTQALVRIYEGKKGVRVDLSQVRDTHIMEALKVFAGEQPVLGQYKGHNGVEPDSAAAGKDGCQADPDELIGTDESGKGDYFGPLVVAGVYADSVTAPKLREMGVDDSKKLSDRQIKSIASGIRELCPYSVITIGNQKYNTLYKKIGNLNRLLAWGHARAIENILNSVKCSYVLSDRFGDPRLIENALMEKGRTVVLSQRPRAEENVAVAAASILARDGFVSRLEQMEMEYGIQFPKGASSRILETAREFVGKFGRDRLENVAKLHFKTSNEI